ncbi:MAG: 50S ribosomal protein L19 [bacterium]|nr:50S ribosomal protein L19 [bacterium]
MLEEIKKVEEIYKKKEIPEFTAGDTVKVTIKFKELDTWKKQVFEGIVIARRGSGLNETFTVRKISYGVGVERIFPIHSPFIERIEVLKKGRVRRAKLYYLRGKSEKESRI